MRLALEAGGIAYRDRARAKGADIEADMEADRADPPFAPPYLVADGMTIAQTANILMFLGERHGLAPADERGKVWVNQLQLTIADMVTEAHDAHHPIASSLYYEDQKPEAARNAQVFREERIPKFLGYFERILETRGDYLAGGKRWTYADLSLFQLVDGLRFAFPKRINALEADYPRVMALHRRIAALPALQDYLNSTRRLEFGDGIFRHYPELDAA